MHNVGKFYREKPELLPENADVTGFLDLLLQIVRNESLHVSIPILHLWAQILNSSTVGSSPPVMALIGPLLDLCSQRLIRYELLPEDSTYPAILFINEDVDTVPEKHAFLGNYMRFGKEIVESIVQKRPYDALYHLLAAADHILRDPYEGGQPFIGISLPAFMKSSLANPKQQGITRKQRFRY